METESRKFLDEWFEGWRRTDLLYDRFLKRHGLNLTTYFVLELLYRHPEGVEPAVIAEKVFVLRQTVTVVLNEFEKRGFIRRCESQEDHRRKRILLTKSGRAFIGGVCSELAAIEEEALAEIPVETRRAGLELMRCFAGSFGEIMECGK